MLVNPFKMYELQHCAPSIKTHMHSTRAIFNSTSLFGDVIRIDSGISANGNQIYVRLNGPYSWDIVLSYSQNNDYGALHR